MSSLASSPPKGGGSPSLSSWTRMQGYPDPHIRHPLMDPTGMNPGTQQADRRAVDPNARRVMSEEIGMGMPKNMPPHNMYMGEFRYMHRPYGHPSQYPPHPVHSYMSAERDYRHPDEHFGEYGEGGGAVRDVAGRMGDVRMGPGGGMGPGSMPPHMEYAYPRRPGPEGEMRERIMLGGEHMHGMHDPHMKMHPGFVGMYGGMGGGHVPFVSAQPPHLPFGAMHGHPVAAYEVTGPRAVPSQAAKHNKYCHFCQHVKVRASGMLACCNKDCTRRFCEHCLSKSIGDDVNPQTSTAWIGGQWHCPVCRKLCCCALGECDKNHRHCKAYRYRVRRAEQQAFKRTGTAGGEEEEAEGGGVEDKAAGAARESKAGLAAAKMEVEVGGLIGANGKTNGAASPPVSMLDSHAPTKKEGPGGSLTKSPSPGANQMRMRMPGQGGAVAGSVAEQPGFDFHDVQSVADSWLKLFQDEDVEDDSFLFHGMNAPRGGQRVSRQSSTDVEGIGGIDTLSLQPGASKLLSRPQSSDSISGLAAQGRSNSSDLIQQIEGGGMRRVGSNDSLGNMVSGSMRPSGSTDSLSLMGGVMPRNTSNDSLGNMIPRNLSNSSLAAVGETTELWTGAGEESGTPGGDFDYLAAGIPAGSAGGQFWPSGTPPDGAKFGGMTSSGTGKRMVRTSSHNKLVHEAAPQTGSGMPRPPSFEKLSRACRPDLPQRTDYSQLAQMPPTQEDESEG